MSLGKPNKNDNTWMPLSDMMTGLMVIFMFIAISYIDEVKSIQNEIDDKIKGYTVVRNKIQMELDSTFTERFRDYELVINPDLSIQISDTRALLASQKFNEEVVLKNRFKTFLDEFTPLFYNIIIKEEYRDYISEIRIEGHTGIATLNSEFDKDYYQKMLILSQKRSNKVLEYMMNNPFYKKLEKPEKKFLRFITTSNGLAFGKALDEDGEFIYETNKPIKAYNSLRVEFKIVTNNQVLVDALIKLTNDK